MNVFLEICYASTVMKYNLIYATSHFILTEALNIQKSKLNKIYIVLTTLR